MASKRRKLDRLTNLLLYDINTNSFIINNEPVNIKEGNVISAALIGDNIIFSLEGQKIFKLTNDKRYFKIFQGDNDPNDEEYTQIQTDFSDPNIFYAYLNSKIFEFRIENETAIRQSKLNMPNKIQFFDNYVISSKYIATQRFMVNKLKSNEEYDEEEEEEEEYIKEEAISEIYVISRNSNEIIHKLVTPVSSTIYIDKTFSYIYNEDTKEVSVYLLDFTSNEPYKVINSVVKIIKGDKIGLQTSDNMIHILGQKSNELDSTNIPISSYIYKNIIYNVGPEITSPIVPMPMIKYKIPNKIETSVYFDNTNTFFFKRSLKNEIILSKNVSDISSESNEDRHFLFQLMLQQDYYLVSANKSLILYKSVAETKEYSKKVLYDNMNFPINSLVSDLQESFSFYGLESNGDLFHFKLDMNSFKPESKSIEKGVLDFCASFNYITILKFYNAIHIINRSTNSTSVIPRELIERENSKIMKITNDDEFLYILYKIESKVFCYRYKIDCPTEDPLFIDDVYLFWRTSNNGSICIQNRVTKLITCGKHTYSFNKLVKGVAFSKGSFCIWKDDLQNPDIFTLYSDSLSTTFYNGFCCFFYDPNHDTFALRYNDDQSYYLSQIDNEYKEKHTIRGTIDDSLSATVIGLNTIVFSTNNGLTLLFVSLNEQHCYSINIDIPQKSLTNLMPHPNDMYSFFALNHHNLYMLTYDQSNIEIRQKQIMKDVLSYSVSKNYILVQLKDDSDIITKYRKTDPDDTTNVFIYELEKVTNSDSFDGEDYAYRYSFSNDFPHADKNLISYFIDDDFVYVFKHQIICNYRNTSGGINTECKLYKLEDDVELTKVKKSYDNVLNVFDSFQVIIVLSGGKFVFKNKIYDYQYDEKDEKVQTLFAACQDEVMVWNTFIHKRSIFNFDEPSIYKQPVALKPIINCWFDGEKSLLFKRGESGFLVNDQVINIEKLSFLKPRFILKLNNDKYLIISSDQFIIIRNAENKDIKDVGILASADSYRSDPSDLNRFFAHFRQNKQLYIVQYDRDFYHRCYCNDVVKYDISRNYFVFIDSKGLVHLMKRDSGFPSSFESEEVDQYINDQLGNDASYLIPFIDDWYVYFLDSMQKTVRRFIISDDISEMKPINNVVNIWSTDGVVIQTYEDEQFCIYVKDIQLKSKTDEKVFAAALNDKNICIWIKNNDVGDFNSDIESHVANLDEICEIPEIQQDLEEKMEIYRQQISKIIEPIQADMLAKRENINESFEKVEHNLDEIVKLLQTQHDNKFDVKALNEMDDENFVNFVKQKDFIGHFMKFNRTPPMFILILIKKAINHINNEKQEIEFWIPLLYKALSILPLDPITKAACKPFLSGFKELIVELIEFIESSPFENLMKKKLTKCLMHIDVILSSFSKK